MIASIDSYSCFRILYLHWFIEPQKKQLRASQALGLWPFGVFWLGHHQAIDSEAKYTYGRVYDENLNIIKRWIKDAGFQVVEARQEAGQRHGLAGRAGEPLRGMALKNHPKWGCNHRI